MEQKELFESEKPKIDPKAERIKKLFGGFGAPETDGFELVLHPKAFGDKEIRFVYRSGEVLPTGDTFDSLSQEYPKRITGIKKSAKELAHIILKGKDADKKRKETLSRKNKEIFSF